MKPKDYYAELVESSQQAWMGNMRPHALWLPTVLTKARSAQVHSANTLLAGKLSNRQTEYELLVTGSTTQKGHEGEERPRTLVEESCQCHDLDDVELGIARCASFGSEVARNEANAIAFSFFYETIKTGEQSLETLTNGIALKIQRVVRRDSSEFLCFLMIAWMGTFNVSTDGSSGSDIGLFAVKFWVEHGGEVPENLLKGQQ